MFPTAWMYQAVVCCWWSDFTTPATPYGRANSTPTTIGGRDGILTLSYSGKSSWRSGLISTRAMSCGLISPITVIVSRVRSCARRESWCLVVAGVGVEKVVGLELQLQTRTDLPTSLPTRYAVLGYMGGCVVICHMMSHDLSTTSPQFQAAIDRQQYIQFITQ